MIKGKLYISKMGGKLQGLDGINTNPLKNKLLQYNEVEFVEWRMSHPLISNPEFYLRVRKGKARDFLKKAIEERKSDFKELLDQLEE